MTEFRQLLPKKLCPIRAKTDQKLVKTFNRCLEPHSLVKCFNRSNRVWLCNPCRLQ